MPEEQPTPPNLPAAPKGPGGPRRRGHRGGRGRRRPPARLPTRPPRPQEPQEPHASEAGEAISAPPELAEAPPVYEEQRGAPEAAPEEEFKGSAISRAVSEVTQIVEELRKTLGQMEEVLELVELAERQKLGDEREIDSLRRALQRIHRPRGDQRGHSQPED